MGLRVTAGCFRHCGRDNPHRGAAGWAYAYFWRLWIWNRNFQLLGSCVSDIGRWFLSRNLTNWRQPVAHAQPFRGQFRCCQQPAAVLFRALCDPRLSPGRRGVEGGGRVFPALSARQPSPWSSWLGIIILRMLVSSIRAEIIEVHMHQVIMSLHLLARQGGLSRTRTACPGSAPRPQTAFRRTTPDIM